MERRKINLLETLFFFGEEKKYIKKNKDDSKRK